VSERDEDVWNVAVPTLTGRNRFAQPCGSLSGGNLPELALSALMGLIALAGNVWAMALSRAFSQGVSGDVGNVFFLFRGWHLPHAGGGVFRRRYRISGQFFGSCVIAGAGLYVWHRKPTK